MVSSSSNIPIELFLAIRSCVSAESEVSGRARIVDLYCFFARIHACSGVIVEIDFLFEYIDITILQYHLICH